MKGLSVPNSGIAYPGDMQLLKQVFDRICRQHHVEEGSRDAENVARAAMSLFQAGVFDETELIASLEEFMRRHRA